jgi:manganese-dependent inorganic pyrophosphatase
MPHIYVTGHRNPDTDTIASAIGYAELKGRLDPENVYAPARLGDVNTQTRWALEKSGAVEPKLLKHIMLRVKDVMNEVTTTRKDDPLRNVGLTMAKENISQVPIVDEDGALVGIVTEKDLARMYVRESREASTFVSTPVSVHSMVEVLEGELLVGENRDASGKLWVMSMSVDSMGQSMEPGDIVVIGDRTEGQRRAIQLGAGILVVSNGVRPEDEVLKMAEEKGVSVMTGNPLTVDPDELLADITNDVMAVHYRAAIAVDGDHAPVGILTRTDLLNPEPRRVLLVDHAERGQSVPGVEHAQVVEILDHHNVGNIETRIPIPATFDPVGSTATLIVERYRANGVRPEESTAKMLLAAILSDTVIFNSPTTTDRDREVARYLEEMLGVDAREFGMEMFEASSDVSDLSAEEIIGRDQKEYALGDAGAMSISQIETVGPGLLERKSEMLDALERLRQRNGYLFAALMVTDIVEGGTDLLCVGDCDPVERVFDKQARENVIDLPGVMSRKKQVAPKLLAAF